MTLIDSHCHLDDAQFDSDREDAIRRAADAGVTTMLCIGTGEGPPDLEPALRLTDRHSGMLATAGIHPQYAPHADDKAYNHLAEVLRHPKCVALGEIGLDYHWQPYDQAQQARVFLEQMRIAADARKPIIIHTRDAWRDTMSLLREHWAPTGLPCVMHCFTGGPEEVAEALALGFYISFAGIVTYPRAENVRQAAAAVPSDRLLVETDAPYLPPVPFRGKRNEPAYVVHTARRLAEVRNEDPEQIAAVTTANFRRIFLQQSAPGAISYTEGFE